MPLQQPPAQTRFEVRSLPESMIPATAAATIKEIPYDYAARFTLKGIRGNREQDVINISIEGAFVAVAVGYSFIPPPWDGLKSTLPPSTLALVKELASAAATEDPTTLMLAKCLLRRICGIDFKYSILDSGTGRELQNQPLHNLAGLGESTGHRPFRPLAKPMLFMPRSTIRIEIEEISEGPLYGYEFPLGSGRRIGAELFIVLHGYKILGYGTASP
jgi:hypothetical protein